MTIFLFFFGLGFVLFTPEFYLISAFVADLIFRLYSLICIKSLHKKFKTDENEQEMIMMRENLINSYGTIINELRSTPSHHVMITLSRSSIDSKDIEVLDED